MIYTFRVIFLVYVKNKITKKITSYCENVRYKFTSEFKLRISEIRNGNKSKNWVLFVPIILKLI